MEKAKLLELFPAFHEIKDASLREQSLKAMTLAMEKGGWNEENIRLCPVTLNWKGCDVSWVEHVADVTALCLSNFDALEKYYRRHNVPFSRDVVAAGALLHDIGKLTEFACADGKPVHSENYELMRHPLSGAVIAAEAGLPDILVHLIATHSFEGDKSYLTAEADFVRTIDQFAFKCSVYGLPKKQ